MGFDKDYPNRKDHRQQYKKRAQRCDTSCRPGGSCPQCLSNRQHANEIRRLAADEQIEEIKKEDDGL